MRLENPCCKGIHAKSTIMKSTKDLLASVKSSLDGLAFETPLILLCSGGVDSMTLTKALFELKVEHVLFHVNYRIRGEDSDADADVVASWAAQTGIPFHQMLAPKDFSQAPELQSRARVMRLDGARSLCKSLHASHLVTAHHADDAAETFLFHAARGSGIDGLIAMQPLRDDVIRPFWNLHKTVIRQAAKTWGIPWREDQSNATDAYTRNHLRHHAMPALIDAMPYAVSGLVKTMGHLREMHAFVEASIAREGVLYMGGSTEVPGHQVIYRDVLDHPHSKVILWYLLKDYAAFDPQAIMDLGHSQVGAHLTMPGWALWAEREGLILIPERTTPVANHVAVGIQDNFQGDAWLDGLWQTEQQWVMEAMPQGPLGDYGSLSEPVFAWDRLPDQLHWRTWIEGDFIEPFGMSQGQKKVSDALTEAKVPSCMRSQVWVLARDQAVAGAVYWIPHIRLSRVAAIQIGDKQLSRCFMH